MSQNLLEVQNVKKVETLSIVEECGSGKSTTGKALMKLVDEMEERAVGEPVSAFDISIQLQILNFLNGLQEQYKLTYVFMTHNVSVVERILEWVGVMYLGRLVDWVDGVGLFGSQRHSYTKALLSAVPILRG